MFEVKERKTSDIMAASAQYSCRVRQALFYIEGFIKELMCGRCHPCALGSGEALVRLTSISEGRGSRMDIEALRRITKNMHFGSMCKKGKDSAEFLRTWLDSADFDEHINGICSQAECRALFTYTIDSSKCALCGLCKDACSHSAITGEKRKAYLIGYPSFQIKAKRCTSCGECASACPEGAISRIDTGAAPAV